MPMSSNPRLILILDNIRSLYNVGAIFRTAEGLGVSEVILCGITPTPPRKEIHKTALGAETRISWKHVDSTIDFIKEVKQEDALIYALELTPDAIPLDQFSQLDKFDQSKPIYLVVGHERNGVDDEVLTLVDQKIMIPMHGKVKSLNVASATAIACWQLLATTHTPAY
jgi:23S rRNA (guanosine2251-2'-O)-methyltransferase